VGVEGGIFSPTQPAILAELGDLEPVDRSTMNAFENQAFRDAVAATGRKRLIVAGLHTEVCLALATVEALKHDYEVMFVTDAVGGRGQVAHRTAIERMTAAGAVPNTTLAVVMELFRDWASPLGEAAGELTGWYLVEAPKLPGEVVGMALVETLRWNGQVAA
jgi:nicotinamidase-related amidase